MIGSFGDVINIFLLKTPVFCDYLIHNLFLTKGVMEEDNIFKRLFNKLGIPARIGYSICLILCLVLVTLPTYVIVTKLAGWNGGNRPQPEGDSISEQKPSFKSIHDAFFVENTLPDNVTQKLSQVADLDDSNDVFKNLSNLLNLKNYKNDIETVCTAISRVRTTSGKFSPEEARAWSIIKNLKFTCFNVVEIDSYCSPKTTSDESEEEEEEEEEESLIRKYYDPKLIPEESFNLPSNASGKELELVKKMSHIKKFIDLLLLPELDADQINALAEDPINSPFTTHLPPDDFIEIFTGDKNLFKKRAAIFLFTEPLEEFFRTYLFRFVYNKNEIDDKIDHNWVLKYEKYFRTLSYYSKLKLPNWFMESGGPKTAKEILSHAYNVYFVQILGSNEQNSLDLAKELLLKIELKSGFTLSELGFSDPLQSGDPNVFTISDESLINYYCANPRFPVVDRFRLVEKYLIDQAAKKIVIDGSDSVRSSLVDRLASVLEHGNFSMVRFSERINKVDSEANIPNMFREYANYSLNSKVITELGMKLEQIGNDQTTQMDLASRIKFYFESMPKFYRNDIGLPAHIISKIESLEELKYLQAYLIYRWFREFYNHSYKYAYFSKSELCSDFVPDIFRLIDDIYANEKNWFPEAKNFKLFDEIKSFRKDHPWSSPEKFAIFVKNELPRQEKFLNLYFRRLERLLHGKSDLEWELILFNYFPTKVPLASSNNVQFFLDEYHRYIVFGAVDAENFIKAPISEFVKKWTVEVLKFTSEELKDYPKALVLHGCFKKVDPIQSLLKLASDDVYAFSSLDFIVNVEDILLGDCDFLDTKKYLNSKLRLILRCLKYGNEKRGLFVDTVKAIGTEAIKLNGLTNPKLLLFYLAYSHDTVLTVPGSFYLQPLKEIIEFLESSRICNELTACFVENSLSSIEAVLLIVPELKNCIEKVLDKVSKTEGLSRTLSNIIEDEVEQKLNASVVSEFINNCNWEESQLPNYYKECIPLINQLHIIFSSPAGFDPLTKPDRDKQQVINFIKKQAIQRAKHYVISFIKHYFKANSEGKIEDKYKKRLSTGCKYLLKFTQVVKDDLFINVINTHLSPSPEFEDKFVCLYMTHLISSIRELNMIFENPVKVNEKNELLHYLFKALDMLDNLFKRKKGDFKSRGHFVQFSDLCEQFSEKVIEAKDIDLIPIEVLDQLDDSIISYLWPQPMQPEH